MNLINENIQMQNKIALNNNLINSIMNQFLPQIKNPLINGNNQNQQLKEVIPRSNNYKNFICFPEKNTKRINIRFSCSTGLCVNCTTPEDITIKDLILCFARFLGLRETILGKDIIFIYNACKINVNDEENIIQYGLSNDSTITVLDQNNIYGGNNCLFNEI